MKLSEAIIIQKLKQKFALNFRDGMSDELSLERPLFYVSGDPFEKNKVYVAYADQMEEITPEQTEGTLAFIIGILPKQLSGSRNVYSLLAEVSPYQLLNCIQHVFDYYDEWEQKLEHISKTDTSIQDMLDVSYRIFHNPIIIHSSDYFIVAYSSVLDQKQELEGILDTNALFEYNNEFKNEMKEYASIENGKTFFIPEYITGVKAMCRNVYDNGRYVYRIAMVEQQRRFYGSDEALFSVLTRHLNFAIIHNNFQEAQMGYQLDRLLSDSLSGAEIPEQSFDEFGWHQQHQYFCMCIKVAALDLENLTVRFICNHICSLVPNSSAFFYRDCIAVFVNLTRAASTQEEILSELVYFLRDSYLKAGISREFSGLSQMEEFIRQARIALDMGIKNLPYQWVYRFDDIVMEYILESTMAELPRELIACRQVLELKEHDKNHQTDYYETLRIYVQNNLNAVQSAKQLYIHRSTFLYRMDKIEELVHLDLTNEETLLYVMFTFRLLEKKD